MKLETASSFSRWANDFIIVAYLFLQMLTVIHINVFKDEIHYIL